MNDDLPPLPEPARWYCVSKEGLATFCVDEADAREEAAYANESWPRHAPYRAVQLVTADQLRAAVLAERERCADIVMYELGKTGQARAIAAAIRKGTP